MSQCKSGYGARRVRSVPRRRLRWIDGSLLTNHLEPYRRAIFTAVLDERDASGRPRYKDGRTGEWRTCATWTIRWYAGGRHHKGGGFPTEKAARRELRAKQEASAQGQYVPGADRTTFEDLATLLLDEYRANGRRFYRRYAIVAEQDLKDGVAKLAALHQKKPLRPLTAPEPPQVVTGS